MPLICRAALVALRKESVDRNVLRFDGFLLGNLSLSARRAWIEMECDSIIFPRGKVALRKESVDRNVDCGRRAGQTAPSLSARRAWIEMGMWAY